MGYDPLLPMWIHQLALSILLQVAWLLLAWTVLKPTSLTWNFIILFHEFSSLFFSLFIRMFFSTLTRKTFPLQIGFMLHWTLRVANIERVLLSSRLWYQLPTTALFFLRIGNYQQSPNKTMKNQDEKKEIKIKILKLKSLELIHDTADLERKTQKGKVNIDGEKCAYSWLPKKTLHPPLDEFWVFSNRSIPFPKAYQNWRS